MVLTVGDEEVVVTAKGEVDVRITKAGAIEVEDVDGYSKAKIVLDRATLDDGKIYVVSSIGKDALKGLSVSAIVVGDKVTTIGVGAFSKCGNLTSLTLGESVKTVNKNVLSGSKKLKKVTIKSAKLSKKSCKNLIKGSKVKTIKVSIKDKKLKKKVLKKYKKYFSKANTGRKVVVK